MSRVDAQSDLWMRRFHGAQEGGPRLVCFPHAGGSATYFYPLSQALAPEVDVVTVQYPGRQDRRAEDPIESIPELADQIVAAAGEWLDGAPALYGHSMGATLAFEVACRLQRDTGTPPSILIVSGRRAPSVERDDGVHLRDEEGLVDEMRELGGTDTAFLDDAELRDLFLPAVRGDYKAIETYRFQPGPRLRCPITVMLGESDPRVTRAEAEVWRDHTDGACSFHSFPGGHFFISERAAEVTRVIADDVARVAGR